MMIEKTLGIVIGGLNLCLIIASCVLFMRIDKTAPVITVGDCNYVYEDDLPKEILCQGITAFDKEDGDVTEFVVIEKVVTNREKKTASITYGVTDRAGNVGKATRTIEMSIPERVELPTAGEAGNVKVEDTTTASAEQQEEEAEETVVEGEGTTGGGNVTVVGSSRRE